MHCIIQKQGVYLINPFLVQYTHRPCAHNENVLSIQSLKSMYAQLEIKYEGVDVLWLPNIVEKQILYQRIKEQKILLKLLLWQLCGENI